MNFSRINRRTHLLECQNKHGRDQPRRTLGNAATALPEEPPTFHGALSRGRRAPVPLAAPESRAPPNPGKLGLENWNLLWLQQKTWEPNLRVGALKGVFISCLNFCRALSLNTLCYLKNYSVLKIPFL